MKPSNLLSAALLGASLACLTTAQSTPRGTTGFGRATHVIVPQLQAMALQAERVGDHVSIETVTVRVEIRDQSAHTELELVVRNPSSRAAEAVLLLPVPARAAVSSFRFEGAGMVPSARLLPREEARATYDSIVARLRDPAMLEFVRDDLVRSSLFPVPARGTQRLRLRYEHLLDRVDQRVDYVLPRSESLTQRAPWSIEVSLRSAKPISTVFSPSHEVTTQRSAANRMAVRTTAAATHQPGAFRLSFLLQESDTVTASLYACPDATTDGGHFLLLAGLPKLEALGSATVRREVTLVLDRSGSMAGGKLDQARAAALQVIEGLGDDEGFQIIDYASDVARFAPAPQRRREGLVEARAYLASMRPAGSTNLHGALAEALRPAPIEGFLPIVLFLTDGLPTAGNVSELAIRELVENHNPHARRVFTFGVGLDVNAPLLDRVAEVSRATSTYVLPQESVEPKVARVFEKLRGPMLCDGRIEMLDENGALDTRRVRDLQPAVLPDLFVGDQLVLLGRYCGDAPLRFRICGTWMGQPRTFRFRFDLARASHRNAFVPRLWASRRIADLVDRVRQAGAGGVPGSENHALTEAGAAELRDEILTLSTTYGVLSEYTAFLATEGADLSDWKALDHSCQALLDRRAVQTRSGAGACNQALNIQAQKAQVIANYRNEFLDEKLQRVEYSTVQQVCDRAFFRRGSRWIDGQLVRGGSLEPDRVVMRGSAAHDVLLRILSAQGRNAMLSLRGEILLKVGDEKVLVGAFR